jgi:hypothetical protein
MRGGKRIGSGRKYISPENKKVQLTNIYIEQKIIDKLRKDNIKILCKNAINNAYRSEL